MIRESLVEMEKVFSRRAFFGSVAKVGAVVAAFDRFGGEVFGANATDPASVAFKTVSAFGRSVIPVDEDPGWATFDPGITDYCLNTYIRQCFMNGSKLAFDGLTGAINSFNEIPFTVGYGPRFIDMASAARDQFLSDILTGAFEYDGVQDVLGYAGIFMLLGTKETFFLNYPNHLPVRGAEYQVRVPLKVKTGWDIMQLKGPVGPAEETKLRARYFDAKELPGVDLRNPYI